MLEPSSVGPLTLLVPETAAVGATALQVNAVGVTISDHEFSVPVSASASSATCIFQVPCVLRPLTRESWPTGSGPRFGMPNRLQIGELNAGSQSPVNGASAAPLRLRSLTELSSKTVLVKLSPSPS